MPTSYIVVAGEYSDRHVCGVYTTKEKADAAAEIFDGWVEEFEPDALPDHPAGTLGYYVTMEKGGTAYTQRAGMETFEIYGKGCFLDRYARAENGALLGHKEYVIAVWARDEQHAAKIVNEKRAQIIAANEWPADPPPPDQRGFASTGLFHPPITETVLGDPIL